MNILHLHDWDLTPGEAIEVQRRLATRVDTRTPLNEVRYVAGADVSYARFSDVFHAGVVVLRAEDQQVVERRGIVGKGRFPYIPGLLSFREAPVLLRVFQQIELVPDVVLIDGQGLAHPRRLGIACHLGLLLDVPTIGCAKSRLIGTHRSPAHGAGSMTALKHEGETIGKVVRTKNHVKPLYVSVGHHIDLASSTRIVLACCRGYRLPEPTRQAHLHVNALRTEAAC